MYRRSADANRNTKVAARFGLFSYMPLQLSTPLQVLNLTNDPIFLKSKRYFKPIHQAKYR